MLKFWQGHSIHSPKQMESYQLFPHQNKMHYDISVCFICKITKNVILKLEMVFEKANFFDQWKTVIPVLLGAKLFKVSFIFLATFCIRFVYLSN